MHPRSTRALPIAWVIVNAALGFALVLLVFLPLSGDDDMVLVPVEVQAQGLQLPEGVDVEPWLDGDAYIEDPTTAEALLGAVVAMGQLPVAVRITADHNLMYLAIPWEANTDDSVPSRLGPVLGREPGVIIEVKWFDKLPHWADELYGYIREHMVNERPSKYVIAMRHLFGEMEQTG